MARNVTLYTLRERIRELGEIREAYVTNLALDREIESSRLELFDKLVSSASDDYFESTQNVSVTSGTNEYALPSDYYKTIAVDVMRTDGSYVNIERYNKGERNKYSINTISTVHRECSMYRIRGDNLTIIPTPNWTETNGIMHLYVAAPATILYANGAAKDETNAKTTNIDGVSGWDDWIVFDCLIKFVGGKEEGDASQWEGLLAKLNNRIEEMKYRDRGEPDSIRDIEEERYERLVPRYGSSV